MVGRVRWTHNNGEGGVWGGGGGERPIRRLWWGESNQTGVIGQYPIIPVRLLPRAGSGNAGLRPPPPPSHNPCLLFILPLVLFGPFPRACGRRLASPAHPPQCDMVNAAARR